MTYHEKSAEHDAAHPHDVRAGPGDAGATDRPEHLPESREDRRQGRSATLLFLCLLGAGGLLVILLNWAALI
ncbi:hypothetical protein [Salipiger abyssi]|uniref:hypothetical protein n=1 Tax=Salipiger abyssi TaxID=1250539 RepID=UPI001A90CB4B|nr:hypothetical protein [Salipiger abyssi]MBN9885984.1 hypothetical protein [Salipiger abyssi]